MKTLFTSLLLIAFAGAACAQSAAGDAAYKKDPTIPAFNILLADSTWYTKADLPQNKYDYTFIIYFSPDCGHCQHEATEIVKHMDSLKNAFFLFVAYKPLEDVKGFAAYYHLDKYDNIKVGRDPKYFVPSFYRVTRTPFIVAYNKKGLLEKVYDPEEVQVPEAEDLVKLVNGIK